MGNSSSKMKKPTYYRTLFVSKWLPPMYDFWVSIGVLGNTKALREKILSFIPKNPKIIIDLACGTGEAALLLKKEYPNSRVLASDLSEGMLKQIQKKAVKQNLTIEISLQDAVKTSYQSNIADVVIISFAIHDLPHIQRLLVMQEAYRLLKKGGVFIIYEYHMPQFPLFRLPIYIQFFLVENKEAWGIFTEPLQEELSQTGFTKTKKRTFFKGLAQIVAGIK